MNALRAPVCMIAGLLLGACATTPSETGLQEHRGTGALIARAALEAVGTPYVYGGNTPDGFDCSGLVQYVHSLAGITVPRTSADQYRGAPAAGELAAGDVLFFRIDGKISHSGIYIGNGKFVHAPSFGKQVGVARTDNPYFQPRFIGARRFYQ